MDDNEGSVNLIPDVSSGLLQAKPAKNIPLAKAKPSKSGAHKKAEPIQVRLVISFTGFVASVQSSPTLDQAIQYNV